MIFNNYGRCSVSMDRAPNEKPNVQHYKRFGTTKERDGWQMANPTGNKVIYVKAG